MLGSFAAIPPSLVGPGGKRCFFLGARALYVCQLVFHELSYSTIDNCLMFFLAGATTGIGAERSCAGANDFPALERTALATETELSGHGLAPGGG